jgi:hypothetical protein
VSTDPVLVKLLDEVNGYPVPDVDGEAPAADDLGGVAVPFRTRTAKGVLIAYSTTTIFGTPVDVALDELAIESFLRADAVTARILREYAAPLPDPPER